jgi:uncharacterized protein DUF3551
MMKAMSIGLVALTGAIVSIASSGPAAAVEYPYCIQGGGWGVPGDCSYRSYAECMASASGRLVYCGINPRFAFEAPRRGRQSPAY